VYFTNFLLSPLPRASISALPLGGVDLPSFSYASALLRRDSEDWFYLLQVKGLVFPAVSLTKDVPLPLPPPIFFLMPLLFFTLWALEDCTSSFFFRHRPLASHQIFIPFSFPFLVLSSPPSWKSSLPASPLKEENTIPHSHFECCVFPPLFSSPPVSFSRYAVFFFFSFALNFQNFLCFFLFSPLKQNILALSFSSCPRPDLPSSFSPERL